MNIFKTFSLIIALMTALSSLNGGEYDDIDWGVDYNDAVKIGEKSNKPIMVLITSKRCKWCNKLKSKTLSDDTIIERLNASFSTVEVTRKEDDYPYKKLRARAVPTIYFLGKDGKPLMRPVVGYWNIENFNSYLDDAERLAKKRQ